MSLDEVMAIVNRWSVATEALAALGAELALLDGSETGSPEVLQALHGVSAAAGLAHLDQLASPQRQMITGLIRLVLRQASDSFEHPDHRPGWTFTDPTILEGWGRASMAIPSGLAAAVPELGEVGAFLDVGSGVGLLAVAAARVWPQAAIVGIDVWGPSLERAATNVADAGLGEQITFRHQDVTALDEADAYDCVWLPTFFFAEAVFDVAVPRLFRALRPGGWLVLGRLATPADPLAEAVSTLRIVRVGGTPFPPERLAAALEEAGCRAVRVEPHPGPARLEFVVGQRPKSS